MEYLLVSVTALFVAGLTFFSGFGLGTLLMPVFAVFFPVKIAIAATAMVHLANNIFKVLLVGRHAKLKIVLLFALPGAIAAVCGALLLNYVASFSVLAEYDLFGGTIYITPVKIVIAGLIITIAGVELSPYFRHIAFDAKFIPLGGILSGFLGGLSGHQGALRTAFLVRAGLDKRSLIGTMVVAAVVVDLSRLVIYGLTFLHHDFSVLREQGVIGLIMIGSFSAFAGSFAGSRLLGKMTITGLRRFIAMMLIMLALAMGIGII
ncbi:MAG: TSUP family transporter [Desulfobacterales bacterium]|nr:TSUP family transporter [Desulfobacterales bacterium]